MNALECRGQRFAPHSARPGHTGATARDCPRYCGFPWLEFDLKPENLFVTKDERVKILDFGLAKPKQAGTVSKPSLKSKDAVERVLSEVVHKGLLDVEEAICELKSCLEVQPQNTSMCQAC